MLRTLIAVWVAALVSAGCSPDWLQVRRRLQAPSHSGQTGFLISHADSGELREFLATHPAALVRTLSERHRLYEIFGASQSEVQAGFSTPVEPNIFLPHAAQDPLPVFQIPGPQDFQIGELKPCSGAPLVAPTQLISSGALRETMKLGEHVEFSAHATDPGLRFAFQIVRQDSLAAEKETVTGGDRVPLTLDTLGLHKVFLVAQDAQSNCGIQGLQFIVTDNPAWRPAEELGIYDQAVAQAADLFKHLELISSRESWRLSEGEGVLVAVIDTGVNYNHPGLSARIETLGPDLINGDAFPFDDNGHGTHVSGLIVARGFGQAQRAKLLPIKAMSSLGSDLGTIAAAILYATDHGARIINLSLGASVETPSQALSDAVDYAESRGVLLVTAAGNGDPGSGFGFDIDQHPIYPASLPNENILTVAAFDSINLLALYSNFGRESVDVIAPGGWDAADPIFSTALANSENILFTPLSGTSQAAPLVSGIAAQLWSRSPTRPLSEIKNAIMNSGLPVEELKNLSRSGRHVDALSAVSN